MRVRGGGKIIEFEVDTGCTKYKRENSVITKNKGLLEKAKKVVEKIKKNSCASYASYKEFAGDLTREDCSVLQCLQIQMYYEIYYLAWKDSSNVKAKQVASGYTQLMNFVHSEYLKNIIGDKIKYYVDKYYFHIIGAEVTLEEACNELTASMERLELL